MSDRTPSAGELLRAWRRRRRQSQLALALDADISQRHLSFVESGRSRPSREMLLRLTRQLAVPLRERNAILVAAGFAPVYPERSLHAPELSAARDAVERILKGHEPHPALAVDRHWTLVSSNEAVGPLIDGVAGHLVEGDINVLRLSLHPDGLASRIVNFREWHAHVVARLAHEVDVSGDARLAALLEELESYGARPPPPQPSSSARSSESRAGDSIAVPFVLESPEGRLTFLSTTTVFGTATDVILSEITIECFFPADIETSMAMRRLVNAR